MLLDQILLGMFGGQEIIIILIIVLLLFGGTKIPQLMRGLGRGMNEFKKAKDGISDEEPPTEEKDKKVSQNEE